MDMSLGLPGWDPPPQAAPDLRRSRTPSAVRNSRTAVVPPARNHWSPLTRTASAAPPAARTMAWPGSQSHSGQLCWNQQPSSPSATRPRSQDPEPNMRRAAAEVAAECHGMAQRGSTSQRGGCRWRPRIRTMGCPTAGACPRPGEGDQTLPFSVAGRDVPPIQSLSSSGWKTAPRTAPEESFRAMAEHQ